MPIFTLCTRINKKLNRSITNFIAYFVINIICAISYHPKNVFVCGLYNDNKHFILCAASKVIAINYLQ